LGAGPLRRSPATLHRGQLRRPAGVAAERACPLSFPVPPRAWLRLCPSDHRPPYL